MVRGAESASKEDVGRRRKCGGVLGSGQPRMGPPEASSIREGSGPHASHQPASLLHAADSQDRGLLGEVRTAAGAPGRMG